MERAGAELTSTEEVKERIAAGEPEIVLRNPAARHNLAVGILSPGRVRIEVLQGDPFRNPVAVPAEITVTA